MTKNKKPKSVSREFPHLLTVDGGSASELRRDPVTGNWVVIARGRGKRPKDYVKKKTQKFEAGKKDPFEDPQAHGNAPPVLLFKDKKHKGWSVMVIPNKFPAFAPIGTCSVERRVGPYLVMDGYGFHEVIVTRDAKKHFALFTREEATEVIRAYHERYNALKKEDCVKYISIFHNHGPEAGASLAHPHSQLIAIPVLPADVSRSLSGSNMYFRRYGECVHCMMIAWERKDKKRIVFENKDFVAFCPFISRSAFEVRIFPKKHEAYFERTPQKLLTNLADALRAPLRKLYKVLDNPDYNFFLHTAPTDSREYPNYHWHIEIHPKTAIWAGFEIGTGIEISTIEPEKAARFLQKG